MIDDYENGQLVNTRLCSYHISLDESKGEVYLSDTFFANNSYSFIFKRVWTYGSAYARQELDYDSDTNYYLDSLIISRAYISSDGEVHHRGSAGQRVTDTLVNDDGSVTYFLDTKNAWHQIPNDFKNKGGFKYFFCREIKGENFDGHWINGNRCDTIVFGKARIEDRVLHVGDPISRIVINSKKNTLDLYPLSESRPLIDGSSLFIRFKDFHVIRESEFNVQEDFLGDPY